MANIDTSSTLCENLNFAANEAYKRLRTNVLFSFADGETNHVIGVTSAQPSDGKSTTAINFAYSLATLGNKRVLLVDGDMRKPSVHEKLKIEQQPGLSNLLCSTNSAGNTVHRYKSSKDETTLDVMVSGEIPPNPNELFNSDRMQRLMEQLRTVYDFIVIDLPPVGAVADAQTASKYTDGMIVVVRENTCPREVLDDCVNQLKFAGAKILGFVVNGSKQGGKGKAYSKYGYGEGYGYYK